ncbi:MAG: hypothetical protein CXX71_05815 [Methanobacteriota archaeon]|nr:MAG: hypothetical protein CXX71_05815 [Euryarchaeota archaeon]
MTEATTDEFVRHLQAELVDAEQIQDKRLREQRIWRLEAALQEALEFQAHVLSLASEEIETFEEVTSVRLLASSDASAGEDEHVLDADSSVCRHCDENLESDVPFCPACGGYQ